MSLHSPCQLCEFTSESPSNIGLALARIGLAFAKTVNIPGNIRKQYRETLELYALQMLRME